MYYKMMLMLLLLPVMLSAAPVKFIRAVETNGLRRLQTGAVLFKQAGKPDVNLVGVMHIGEPQYYQALQAELAKADTVLFEGVRPSEDAECDFATAVPEDENGIQQQLATALGLEFQVTAIDYSPKSFVNADTSIEHVMASLKERGGNTKLLETITADEPPLLLNLLMGWFAAFCKENETRAMVLYAMSVLFASDLDVIFQQMEQVAPGFGAVLIQERNAYVMNVLKTYLEKPMEKPTSIALFYGAGHAKDLAIQLRKLGYEPVSKRYFSVFSVNLSEVPNRAMVDQFIQQMMKTQFSPKRVKGK